MPAAVRLDIEEVLVPDPIHKVDFDAVFEPVAQESRVPLYAQVLDQMEGAIRKGLLQPGAFLPSEMELCEGFGIARSTLRRAMGVLESNGTISRTRRRGTRIETGLGIGYRPETSNTIFELITASRREPRTVLRVSECLKADAEIARSTGYRVGTELRRLVRERYANDSPIALLENFLPREVGSFEREELEAGSLAALLAASGWAEDRLEYELSATVLDESGAAFMQLPVGTPVLSERRSAYRDGALINHSYNLYHPVTNRMRGVLTADAAGPQPSNASVSVNRHNVGWSV
jgi:DNA-binding GntR family transcriptional regulator